MKVTQYVAKFNTINFPSAFHANLAHMAINAKNYTSYIFLFFLNMCLERIGKLFESSTPAKTYFH